MNELLYLMKVNLKFIHLSGLNWKLGCQRNMFKSTKLGYFDCIYNHNVVHEHGFQKWKIVSIHESN